MPDRPQPPEGETLNVFRGKRCVPSAAKHYKTRPAGLFTLPQIIHCEYRRSEQYQNGAGDAVERLGTRLVGKQRGDLRAPSEISVHIL